MKEDSGLSFTIFIYKNINFSKCKILLLQNYHHLLHFIVRNSFIHFSTRVTATLLHTKINTRIDQNVLISTKIRKRLNYKEKKKKSLNGKTPTLTATFNRIIFGVTSRRIPFHSRGGAYLFGSTRVRSRRLIKSLPSSI